MNQNLIYYIIDWWSKDCDLIDFPFLLLQTAWNQKQAIIFCILHLNVQVTGVFCEHSSCHKILCNPICHRHFDQICQNKLEFGLQKEFYKLFWIPPLSHIHLCWYQELWNPFQSLFLCQWIRWNIIGHQSLYHFYLSPSGLHS